VFTVWRVATGIVHILTDVKNDEQHSEQFQVLASSIIFSVASAFAAYILSRDAKKLKSLDRGILLTLFPKELSNI
jgi:hypothetical protein